MFFHDEDYNIVPLCTIEVVSSSEDSSEESQQVGMHDQFPMMPKMVQHGDKIVWNKYPWENSQDGASFPDDPKYCLVTSVTRPIVVEQAEANIDYNVKLRLVREAKNGALIYRDIYHREVVKMSDNSPKVDAIWASYQDDHYIGEDGIIYQVITSNDKIPQWWESSLVPTKVVEQQPKNAKDQSQSLNNLEFEQSCTCGDCGITHLLKECPMLMIKHKGATWKCYRDPNNCRSSEREVSEIIFSIISQGIFKVITTITSKETNSTPTNDRPTQVSSHGALY